MPEPESLDDIARTDGLLDALAAERRIVANDAADIELINLLSGWRDDVRLHSHDDVVTESEAVAALREGLAQQNRQKPRHGLRLVGSLAAAMMVLGGFGAVIHGAGPGDSLYGLRSAIFGEAQSVRDDKVALAAQTEMAQVRQLIDDGQWEQAQEKLEVLSTQVASVGDQTVKQDLQQEWDQLSVKVENRDPQATVAPTSSTEVLSDTTTSETSASETSATESSTTETSPSETSATEPSSTEPSSTETSSTETSPSETTEPTSAEPTTTQPSSTQPSATTTVESSAAATSTAAPTSSAHVTSTVAATSSQERAVVEPAAPEDAAEQAPAEEVVPSEVVETPGAEPTDAQG
ncbi:anti-sigma-D factor RsdA [Mycolicibacterium brumae]|nr:anti-sigma-D factor RsdA [Mycolicibacterium brumae]MCV7191569.1 hypothetical protein [Mycolicibacterium brumae]UWW09986.1 anti-sigma-D factor RsdA [Mycolicibacterium brumae]